MTTTRSAAGAVYAPPVTAMSPMVRLRDLRKRYLVRRPLGETLRRPRERRWRDALDGVSLDVCAGELFGILGPNGAGKSTLFRVLSTLVLPDGGTASVYGLDVVEDAPEVRRLVGMAGADERSLHWRLTARENLELFGALHGLRGAALRRRVDETLAVVGLDARAATLAGQLSSGLRQRLLIARALLPSPRVLLLDEPTRSLDPISARDLRRFVRDTLVARAGCTVLLATHAADEAMGLCDRVGVLHRGRLLACGAASTIAEGLRDDRWAFTTTEPAHALWRAVSEDPPSVSADAEPGWWRVEVTLAGGADAVASVVRRLSAAGVALGGAARVELPLAELLERLMAREAGDA